MIRLKWNDGRVTTMDVDDATLPRLITYGASSGQLFERSAPGEFRQARTKSVELAQVIETAWPRHLAKLAGLDRVAGVKYTDA